MSGPKSKQSLDLYMYAKYNISPLDSVAVINRKVWKNFEIWAEFVNAHFVGRGVSLSCIIVHTHVCNFASAS